jgi:hypothetical protein
MHERSANPTHAEIANDRHETARRQFRESLIEIRRLGRRPESCHMHQPARTERPHHLPLCNRQTLGRRNANSRVPQRTLKLNFNFYVWVGLGAPSFLIFKGWGFRFQNRIEIAIWGRPTENPHPCTNRKDASPTGIDGPPTSEDGSPDRAAYGSRPATASTVSATRCRPSSLPAGSNHSSSV